MYYNETQNTNQRGNNSTRDEGKKNAKVCFNMFNVPVYVHMPVDHHSLLEYSKEFEALFRDLKNLRFLYSQRRDLL